MAVFAMISGGGTAGHVVPGLAVAWALVERGHDPGEIHYVGSERGVERTMVPDAGFALTLLPGRGIQRRLTVDNVGASFGLVRAIGRAVQLVRRERPRVLLSLGGYASVPAALAAVLWRVPIVVAEQNAVPGAANRLIARFAKASAVSFAGTALPRAVLTGNPVRAEVQPADAATRTAARHALGIDDARLLVVAFGGSLGARRINQAIIALAESWSDRDDIVLRHVVGARDWDHDASRIHSIGEQLRQRVAAGLPALRYDAVRYEHDMPTIYAAADVIVCRAGASTVAELAVAGVPSVLVPLPGAPGDHQTANAQAMVDAGGARLLPDREASAARVGAALDELVRDAALRASMAAAARTLARPDAASRVAALLEQYARGSDRSRTTRRRITAKARAINENGRP
jgi:undecaprenyldiphospho-muramoylpentapeptide beta-N-acetylglucosaminyltransferase